MGPGAQSRSTEIKPTFSASVSWVKDNHTFKFGGEGRTEGYPTIAFTNDSGTLAFASDQTANPWFSDANVSLSGGSTGFPFASFLMGRANSLTLAAPAEPRAGRKFLDFFAQDTWKVTRKLTLDYGLRWDYLGYPREQYGRAPDFSATLPNAVAGGHPGASIFEGDGAGHCGCSFAQNYYLAFGPRLGIAYQLDTENRATAGLRRHLFRQFRRSRCSDTDWRHADHRRSGVWRRCDPIERWIYARGRGAAARSHLAGYPPGPVPVARYVLRSAHRNRQQPGPACAPDAMEHRRAAGNSARSGGGCLLRRQSRQLVAHVVAQRLQFADPRIPEVAVRTGHLQRRRSHHPGFADRAGRRRPVPQPIAICRFPDQLHCGARVDVFPAVRRVEQRRSLGEDLVRLAPGQGDQAPLSRLGFHLFVHLVEGTHSGRRERWRPVVRTVGE